MSTLNATTLTWLFQGQPPPQGQQFQGQVPQQQQFQQPPPQQQQFQQPPPQQQQFQVSSVVEF